jgi:hypothetical protein
VPALITHVFTEPELGAMPVSIIRAALARHAARLLRVRARGRLREHFCALAWGDRVWMGRLLFSCVLVAVAVLVEPVVKVLFGTMPRRRTPGVVTSVIRLRCVGRFIAPGANIHRSNVVWLEMPEVRPVSNNDQLVHGIVIVLMVCQDLST